MRDRPPIFLQVRNCIYIDRPCAEHTGNNRKDNPVIERILFADPEDTGWDPDYTDRNRADTIDCPMVRTCNTPVGTRAPSHNHE